jgi:hypothetical protein
MMRVGARQMPEPSQERLRITSAARDFMTLAEGGLVSTALAVYVLGALTSRLRDRARMLQLVERDIGDTAPS